MVFVEDYHKDEAEEQAAASLRALARDLAVRCGVSSPRALLSAVQAVGAPEEVALGTPWHTTLMCSVVAAVASPCHLALQAPDEVALGTPWRMAVALGTPWRTALAEASPCHRALRASEEVAAAELRHLQPL